MQGEISSSYFYLFTICFIKGIETVRRDNCRLASELISKCLDMMLIGRDPDGALDYAKETIRSLLLNHIDISKLVITKELTRKAVDYG